MFGNLKGWIFSVPLLLVTLALIYFGGKPEPRSSPTGHLALAMKSVALGTSPTTLVPLGTDTRDGGALLRGCIDKYRDRMLKYKFQDIANAGGKKKLTEAQIQKAKLEKAELVKDFCDEVADAMKCADFSSLFKPEDMVVYGNKPYTETLREIGYNVSDVGILYAGKDSKGTDPERGRRYIEAIFRLGTVMYQDRQVYKEYREGLTLLRQTGFELSYIEPNPEKKKQFESFYKDIDNVLTPQNGIFEIFRAITGDGRPAPEPGDTFDIALKSGEPMWQTEAILRLGRFKFGYATYPDQHAVPEILDEISKRPDLKPNVKVAIDRAKNATMGDFQKIDGF